MTIISDSKSQRKRHERPRSVWPNWPDRDDGYRQEWEPEVSVRIMIAGLAESWSK